LQLPELRVLMLDTLCGQARFIEGGVLVLAEAGPGQTAGQDLPACPGLSVAEHGQLNARSNRRNGGRMAFDFALLKREPK
jgi:hypothetical protein